MCRSGKFTKNQEIRKDPCLCMPFVWSIDSLIHPFIRPFMRSFTYSLCCSFHILFTFYFLAFCAVITCRFHHLISPGPYVPFLFWCVLSLLIVWSCVRCPCVKKGRGTVDFVVSRLEHTLAEELRAGDNASIQERMIRYVNEINMQSFASGRPV